MKFLLAFQVQFLANPVISYHNVIAGNTEKQSHFIICKMQFVQAKATPFPYGQYRIRRFQILKSALYEYVLLLSW